MCDDDPALDEPPQVHATAIIEGRDLPADDAVVYVSHRDSSDVCSGALIARRLVVTAKHCAFVHNRDVPDRPWSASGFRVGFGADVAQLEMRSVSKLEWIGAPAALDVSAAVQRGEDVALLTLSADAPSNVQPLPVQLTYEPALHDEVTLAGYGIRSVVTGASGARLHGAAEVTGFEARTGKLQLLGHSACLGDSGGPVLSKSGAWVGAINEVGSSEDGGLCDLGVTFAASVSNAAVRKLLSAACEQAKCDVAATTIADAAVDSSGDANLPTSTVTDSGMTSWGDAAAHRTASEEGTACACSVAGGTRRESAVLPSSVLLSLALVVGLRVSRRANRARHTLPRQLLTPTSCRS